jgi:4-amino-4-deoxy-L-arabinose transferase-like glycosyltransferase
MKDKIFKYIKKEYVLILILLLAFGLRAWGVAYDIPLTASVSDERLLMSTAIKMLNEHSIIPIRNDGHTYFPVMHYVHAVGALLFSFLLFITGQIGSLAELKASAILSFHSWLLFARLTTVFIGVCSVYLIYLISQKLFVNRKISYISALLFAVSPMHVFLSHFSKLWTPMTFFILLAFYIHLRLWQDPKREINLSIIFLSVLFIFLSFGTASVGILSYIVMMLIIFVYYFELSFKAFFKFIISKWSALLHGILFLGMTIISVIGKNAEIFKPIKRRIFGNEDYFLPNDTEVFSQPVIQRIGDSLYSFLQVETIVFLLLIPAFVYLYKKNKQNFVFLLLSLFLFYFALNPPLVRSTIMRYNSPTLIFLILPSAYLLGSLFLIVLKKSRILALVLLFSMLVPASYINYKQNYLLANNSTRLTVYNWILENVKKDENVFLPSEYLLHDMTPNKDVIELIRKYSPGFYSTRLSYMYENLPDEFEEGYGLYSAPYACNFPVDLIENLEFDYVVITEGDDDSKSMDVCGIKSIDISNRELILEISKAETSDYSLDGSPPMETYRPLWLTSNTGPSVKIYSLN